MDWTNFCEVCKRSLSEPEDYPGLCFPCRLKDPHHPRARPAGRTVDFQESDGSRALYSDPDPVKRHGPARRRHS